MSFKTVIIYIFAFSLIITGIFNVSLTRYIADKIFIGDEKSLPGVFNANILINLLINLPISLLFLNIQGIPLEARILATLTYLTITCLWLVMAFLTTLKDYNPIILSFAAGSAIAVLLSLYLGKHIGLTGYFLGYFLGHTTILFLLSFRIFVEFPSSNSFEWKFLKFMLKNKTLVFIGLFYNLAVWIDKIVFWYSNKSLEIGPILKTFPLYESAVFLAYLTIIPALSVFLIETETSFYNKYKAFYASILNRKTYSQIKLAKNILRTPTLIYI